MLESVLGTSWRIVLKIVEKTILEKKSDENVCPHCPGREVRIQGCLEHVLKQDDFRKFVTVTFDTLVMQNFT
jgi:hypothetical protein